MEFIIIKTRNDEVKKNNKTTTVELTHLQKYSGSDAGIDNES